ncbi:SDR family NAD(P)-dependent oxidoreductase [Pseudomaricurvus alcaniphilus]|uniref:oxidoreductase n=1 Tax=Pseudomaricurvus alcaniphilus TaxID=1166482 RepID=UPI00140ADEA0|nr:oxidoreductase [Pseudomaricurvus alcaniphilus]NHN39324.1 SDR family NAD(P)-dependent oxidoreductase [Pseudomaricurvus alcaniphilus]
MSFDFAAIPSQPGRVAIVTGANTGLGFETARGLAEKGVQVVMACRNLGKAAEAQQRILEQCPEAQLEIMALDLSSLKSVREFASVYQQRFQRLDILINNAGIMIPPYSLSVDGFESQLAANYLGHFLLTGLLLDTLEKTSGSRIVALASLSHKSGKINFNDLQSERKYNAWKCYAQSKLACLIFAYEMQRRLTGADYQTIAVAAHPGVSGTDLSRHIPWLVNKLVAPVVLKFGGQPPEQGVLPILYAALGDDICGGDYTGPTGIGEWKGPAGKVKSTRASHNPEVAARLWSVSEALTGIHYLSPAAEVRNSDCAGAKV